VNKEIKIVAIDGTPEQVLARYHLLAFSSSLRHGATSRMVTDSILDKIIEFFNLPEPSNRNTVLG
jgi:hypothetical protein